MTDIAIPIVFPDYLIAVEAPRAVAVPDLLPGFDLLPDKLALPQYKTKLSQLGHAGIFFIEGRSGTTKYYEYGRYDAQGLGRVEKRTLRDLKMAAGGHPVRSELAYVLSQISAQAGQGGKISGAFIQAAGIYQAMLNYAKKRMLENNNPKRQPYEILSNSCNHFMKQMLEAGGIATPSMIDPRPNSYIEEIRDMYPKLDYTRDNHSLKIDGGPAQLAGRIGMVEQPAAA